MQLPRLRGPHTTALCGRLWQLRGSCPSEGWWAVLVHSRMASARMGKTDSLDGEQTLGGSREGPVFSPFDENASQELFTLGKNAFERDSGEDESTGCSSSVGSWGHCSSLGLSGSGAARRGLENRGGFSFQSDQGETCMLRIQGSSVALSSPFASCGARGRVIFPIRESTVLLGRCPASVLRCGSEVACHP